jgi:hypothetical protein
VRLRRIFLPGKLSDAWIGMRSFSLCKRCSAEMFSEAPVYFTYTCSPNICNLLKNLQSFFEGLFTRKETGTNREIATTYKRSLNQYKEPE